MVDKMEVGDNNCMLDDIKRPIIYIILLRLILAVPLQNRIYDDA